MTEAPTVQPPTLAQLKRRHEELSYALHGVCNRLLEQCELLQSTHNAPPPRTEPEFLKANSVLDTAMRSIITLSVRLLIMTRVALGDLKPEDDVTAIATVISPRPKAG